MAIMPASSVASIWRKHCDNRCLVKYLLFVKLRALCYYEHINNHTRANVNILATAAKNKDNKTYQKLLTLYRDKASQKYITDKYHGTKTEVVKPQSYFKGVK